MLLSSMQMSALGRIALYRDVQARVDLMTKILYLREALSNHIMRREPPHHGTAKEKENA